ncbi:MAG: AmmeMemoRadiSam system radical SAM enzyme, partial [Actinomycetota bacterium]
IAMENGVRYAYTGNVVDPEGQTTRCHACDAMLIGRDGYAVTGWGLDQAGRCRGCGTPCPGVFEASPGTWGERRRPVRLGA